ncbi:MAG: nucleotidyltransferase, partial [Lutimonas sp.]
TNALENMKQKGLRFVPGEVSEWMDCGNKEITVETNSKILRFAFEAGEELVSKTVSLENSSIIEPCYIGENVVLKNSTVGPGVSIGDNSTIENSTVRDSLIQTHTKIENADLNGAMIGNHAHFDGKFKSVSIGDYSELK